MWGDLRNLGISREKNFEKNENFHFWKFPGLSTSKYCREASFAYFWNPLLRINRETVLLEFWIHFLHLERHSVLHTLFLYQCVKITLFIVQCTIFIVALNDVEDIPLSKNVVVACVSFTCVSPTSIQRYRQLADGGRSLDSNNTTCILYTIQCRELLPHSLDSFWTIDVIHNVWTDITGHQRVGRLKPTWW